MKYIFQNWPNYNTLAVVVWNFYLLQIIIFILLPFIATLFFVLSKSNVKEFESIINKFYLDTYL